MTVVQGEINTGHVITVVTAFIHIRILRYQGTLPRPQTSGVLNRGFITASLASWKKAQLERPVRLVHKGGGDGHRGVVVGEAEPPQQGDHQHVHLHLSKPEKKL